MCARLYNCCADACEQIPVCVSTMRASLITFLAGAAVSAAARVTTDYRGSPAPPSFGPAPGEVLVFSDEFDALNMSVWKHEITLTGGGNCR